jgi:hypothetical protein
MQLRLNQRGSLCPSYAGSNPGRHSNFLGIPLFNSYTVTNIEDNFPVCFFCTSQEIVDSFPCYKDCETPHRTDKAYVNTCESVSLRTEVSWKQNF